MDTKQTNKQFVCSYQNTVNTLQNNLPGTMFVSLGCLEVWVLQSIYINIYIYIYIPFIYSGIFGKLSHFTISFRRIQLRLLVIQINRHTKVNRFLWEIRAYWRINIILFYCIMSLFSKIFDYVL